MPATTRSKRKSEPHSEAPVSKKRIELSNLTNFKSKPKKARENDKVSSQFLPVVVLQRWVPPLTDIPPVPATQSGEFVLSQVPSFPGNSEDEGVKMMRKIKRVLENNFKDVSDRLQLQSVPPCLYDLKHCHKCHSKKVEVELAGSESQYLAKNFLDEDRHAQFMFYVRNSMCGRKEFPGVTVVRGVLELILKLSADDSKSCAPTTQTLAELHSLFTSILATFPACHLRNFYLQLFRSPFKVATIRVESPERGMLHAMLELLSDLIQSDATNEKQKRQSMSHDMLNNFFLWDAHSDEKASFENFERDEKFHRIFTVLDLLTRVLENDLAMYIIKFSRRLQSSIGNENHQPLICAILWQSYESVIVVNATIKNIIDVFVSMIALNYPAENVRVIARLLNLVSQVTNLYEYPDETFEYPSYNNLTMDLVRALQKAIESSCYYSVDLYTSVAGNLRTPLMQMLLTNEVLTKIHGGLSQPISLKVPFECIRKKEFAKFKEVQVTAPVVSQVKFPPLNKKQKTKRCEVTQQSYLKLLRIYAASVNNFYRIQASVTEISGNSFEPLPPTLSGFTNFPAKLPVINLEEKVSLRNVDMNFKKLVHIKLNIESCAFYRNEIKYFMILPKLIQKCHERYGEKFGEWMKLTKEMRES